MCKKYSDTGTKLANIGCLTIGTNGEINTTLINDYGVASFVDDMNPRTVRHSETYLCD